MERYDGKTKKDDYKKYALIALGVAAVIVLYNVVTKLIYKVSHPTPDVKVAVACEKVVDFQMQDGIEAYLSPLVGDLDGNGREVAAVVPLHTVENEAIAQAGLGAVGAETDIDRLQNYLSSGECQLFLISDGRRPMPDKYGGNKAENCTAAHCRELPENLAEEDNPYCTDLTGCAILTEQNLGKLPFYGCIQKDVTEAEYDRLVAVLRQMKAA